MPNLVKKHALNATVAAVLSAASTMGASPSLANDPCPDLRRKAEQLAQSPAHSGQQPLGDIKTLTERKLEALREYMRAPTEADRQRLKAELDRITSQIEELSTSSSNQPAARSADIRTMSCSDLERFLREHGVDSSGSSARPTQELRASVTALESSARNVPSASAFQGAVRWLSQKVDALVGVIDETSDIAADDMVTHESAVRQRARDVQSGIDRVRREHDDLTTAGADALAENITTVQENWDALLAGLNRHYGGLTDAGAEVIEDYVNTFDRAANFLLGEYGSITTHGAETIESYENDYERMRRWMVASAETVWRHYVGIVDSGSEIVDEIVRDEIVDIKFETSVSTGKKIGPLTYSQKYAMERSVVAWLRGQPMQVVVGQDIGLETAGDGPGASFTESVSVGSTDGVSAQTSLCGKAGQKSTIADICLIQGAYPDARRKLELTFGLKAKVPGLPEGESAGVVTFSYDVARYIALMRKYW